MVRCRVLRGYAGLLGLRDRAARLDGMLVGMDVLAYTLALI